MKLVLAAALALLGAPALAQAPAAAAPAAAVDRTPVDYRNDANWLCRPGRQDACNVDLTATVVAANGQLTQETAAARGGPVDCFYVYPTVSADPGGNSDLSPGAEERYVAEQQLARFGTKCRLFAPMYRQVTTTALRAALTGAPTTADRELAYADVKAAWNEYLRRDNKRRGVVLIGHSQGAGVLKRLIAEEIEGKPAQQRIVSALLIGTNIAVPAGQLVGGDFKSMPLCSSNLQTGCVVSYVTFRWEAPPPPNTRFGKIATAGQQSACVNPAALTGGAAPLKAYMPNGANVATAASAQQMVAWTTPEQPVRTKFVTLPGLLTGQCVNNEWGSYLAVITYGDPADPRTDKIPGDLVLFGQTQTDWGLHLIDMNVAMGDLVELVGRQGESYRTKAKDARR